MNVSRTSNSSGEGMIGKTWIDTSTVTCGDTGKDIEGDHSLQMRGQTCEQCGVYAQALDEIMQWMSCRAIVLVPSEPGRTDVRNEKNPHQSCSVLRAMAMWSVSAFF